MRNFYLGMKLKRKDETLVPGPGAYNIQSNDNINHRKCSDQLRIKGPRIKTEYF